MIVNPCVCWITFNWERAWLNALPLVKRMPMEVKKLKMSYFWWLCWPHIYIFYEQGFIFILLQGEASITWSSDWYVGQPNQEVTQAVILGSKLVGSGHASPPTHTSHLLPMPLLEGLEKIWQTGMEEFVKGVWTGKRRGRQSKRVGTFILPLLFFSFFHLCRARGWHITK